MTISALSTASSSVPRQSRTDAEKSTLDYNAFLRLFIASMKNQDPTKPNDPSQTLAQLASFSNVEQSIKLNAKLDKLVESSSANLAASLIGKGVSSLDAKQSGVVKSVETGPAGFIAILQDGKRIDLSLGYRITTP